MAKALSPARVREVLVDDEARQATVIVPDDQLSLAIGKDGLNARLAARLTGWRVDIRSETEFAEEESTMGYEEEEVAGRCAAILANGKRCPNASIPGSRYCGLPPHQALKDQEGDRLAADDSEDLEAADDAAAEEGAAAEDVAGAETPPVEEPPAEDPPVEDPPVEEPPVEDPPVEDPPVEEPPVEEPPVDEPPVRAAAEPEPAEEQT